ncbi:MAG: tetratricopeptide repeat protein [Bacteroidales bacterium]|nr:tetratricopeptide repeat protein [Bacteroidales bacterium]
MKRFCLFLIPGFFILSSLSGQTATEYYLKGAAFIEQDSNRLAVENLTQALTIDRSDVKILLKRGEAYYNLNELEHATTDFQDANTLSPDVANLWIARCHARNGDDERALSFLEEHLASDFRLPETQIKRDPAFDDLQLTDEWYMLWQKAWYTAEEAVLREADYYINRNRPDEALKSLESAFARGMNGPDLLSMRGRINLDLGNYGPAVSDLTSAVNLDKGNMVYYKYRGQANLGAGQYKEAVDDFTRVLRDQPEYFDGYLARAEAYAGLQSYDLAVQDVTTYLKYFGSDQSAVFLCGAYLFQKGDYLNALKYFNMNMQDDPENATYYKARGKTYTMTRTYQYAIYDLTMSLDLDPSDGETWLYLGIARLETGDRTTACSDFQKALRAGETGALRYIIDNCQ